MRSIAPRGRRGARGRVPAGMDNQGTWIIAMPAWGDRCMGVMERATFPALRAALEPLKQHIAVVVYTDDGDRAAAAFTATGLDEVARLDLVPLKGDDRSFGQLSWCHSDAMARAAYRDRVALLTADMVVSEEILFTCEQRLRASTKLVCVAAMRTDETAYPDGMTLPGSALLEWAWNNRHHMTKECTWPKGTSYDVWRMYFEKDGNVATRVFLPHPLAVMPQCRTLKFVPTIDVNLINNFSPSVTHMITSPSEGAVIELSEQGKEFLITETMETRYKTRGASIPPFVRCTNKRHRMFFIKKVGIIGDANDVGDEMVVERVLA